MRKGNLILVLAVILFTGIYFYTGIGGKNNEYHLKENENIEQSSNPVNSTFKKPQVQVIKTFNNDGVESCIDLSKIEYQINSEMYEEFLRDNTLSLWTVNDYLREMSNDELELEYMSGNPDAAFVLGMNLVYSSYNTNTTHPDLLKGNIPPKVNKIKDLDHKKLDSGRNWLWQAALNGVGIALAEIAGSYGLENQLIKQNNQLSIEDITNLKAKLTSLELSYQILYHAVNSEVIKLHKINTKEVERKFSNHQYEKKGELLTQLKKKWILNREEIGKQFDINVKISEDIQKIMSSESIDCATTK